MGELPLDIQEEILVRMKAAKDLIRYKSVCKSWYSLISSRRFVDSNLIYNKQADNNEIGNTRIVLTGRSRSDCKYQIAGSSNGLVCVRFDSQLLVVNPSTHQLIKLQSLPQISDLIKEPYPCMGFGYDSSIDDYKVVIWFKNTCTDKYHFLVLTMKLNIWRSVAGELNYYHMFPNGVLCNGSIHWLAFDRNNNPIIVSFNLSKEVFKEIPTPPLDDFNTYNKLGTKKDRLYFLCGTSRNNLKLWVMKNYNVQESTCFFRSTSRYNRKLWVMESYNVQKLESIRDGMLSPPCDDSGRQTIMNCISHESSSGHVHIWMFNEDSAAPVFVQSVESPYVNAHIWLSTISKCNYNHNEHVFVESLVSPHGMGNDNGNLMREE